MLTLLFLLSCQIAEGVKESLLVRKLRVVTTGDNHPC